MTGADDWHRTDADRTATVWDVAMAQVRGDHLLAIQMLGDAVRHGVGRYIKYRLEMREIDQARSKGTDAA